MLADTFDRLMRFGITPGQASDITVAPDLLEDFQARPVLADKAYDGNDLRACIAAINDAAVIPSKRNRKIFIPHDTDIYTHRNQMERCFGRGHPLTQDSPIAPRGHCGLTKQLCEMIVSRAVSIGSVEAANARPFNHIGARMPADPAMPSIVRRIRDAEDDLRSR